MTKKRKTKYFVSRFVKSLAPTLQMMVPDRTRRVLSIALVDVSKTPFLCFEKRKIPLFRSIDVQSLIEICCFVSINSRETKWWSIYFHRIFLIILSGIGKASDSSMLNKRIHSNKNMNSLKKINQIDKTRKTRKRS